MKFLTLEGVKPEIDLSPEIVNTLLRSKKEGCDMQQRRNTKRFLLKMLTSSQDSRSSVTLTFSGLSWLQPGSERDDQNE